MHKGKGHSGWPTAIGKCPETGKLRFSDRSRAKRAGKEVGKGMNAYYCEHCDNWHFGHLPAQVKRGAIGREDL